MLQGSLDNFSLDEVLELLSGTTKTGRLRISGDRGTGSLWLETGQLVDGIVGTLDEGGIEDVVFELMRFKSGNFSFTIDETSDTTDAPQIVDLVVAAAGERLEEWQGIEAVVPSMDHILTPCAELTIDEVTITAEQWRLFVTSGSRAAVREVCADLTLGEVDGSRMLKELIERDLLEINEDARGRSDDAEQTVEPMTVEPVTVEPVTAEPTIAEPVAAGPTFEQTVEPVVAAVAEPVLPLAEAMGLPDANVEVEKPFTLDELMDEADVSAAKQEPSLAEELAPETPAHATPAAVVEEAPSFSEATFSDASFADSAFSDSSFSDAAFSDAAFADTPAAPSPQDLIEGAASPFATFEPTAVESIADEAPFAPPTAPKAPTTEFSPFSAELNETAAHIGITDDLPVPAPAPRSERPPMPAPPTLETETPAAADVELPAPPPSPAEIEDFRTSVHDTSALDDTDMAAPAGAPTPAAPEVGATDEQQNAEAAQAEGEPSSLLMRYLKSER